MPDNEHTQLEKDHKMKEYSVAPKKLTLFHRMQYCVAFCTFTNRAMKNAANTAFGLTSSCVQSALFFFASNHINIQL